MGKKTPQSKFENISSYQRTDTNLYRFIIKHHFPHKRNFNLIKIFQKFRSFLNLLGCIFNFSGSDDPQADRLNLNLTDQEASEE